MTNFLHLQELAAAIRNSNNLTDTILVYIDSELNVFSDPLALQCGEFLKQLTQKEVLRMLELRKTIVEVHLQVHRKIYFLTVL
ncbi:hypothetical protein Tco_1149147, partial [Tanacetum coccineum]